MKKADQSRPARKRGAPPKAERVATSEILASATEIVVEDGSESLSIRRLADRIGISPMAVYNHFSSKDELLGAVIDGLIAAIPAEYSQAEDWEGSLRTFARTIRVVALESPEWIRILLQTRTTSAGLDRMEATLRTLQQKGLPAQYSVAAYNAIYVFAFGYANLDAARTRRADVAQDSFWSTNFSGLSPTRYPTLTASAPELDSISATVEFERALDRLINSLVAEYSRPTT
ncbi:hypothetical protein BJD99_06560 [Rhodococcus sp. 1163]|uniref:TetR/AcrR family transcriptional regulator n=1 Tax=Rhodococcus sp. 1163 TaxID=1905289 RepID=UPI000A0DB5A6|nr:TetR/AcrR family transcriptional regulator C-terminal domain-containing protein [Rhodococcus sp. 1163]ORI20704.1 hypothetical protein BJD99_06560 [Rhodococcus sp. 1163]